LVYPHPRSQRRLLFMMDTAPNGFRPTCFKLSATFLEHTPMSVSTNPVVSTSIQTGLGEAAAFLPRPTTY